jgi:hypothetical protein
MKSSLDGSMLSVRKPYPTHTQLIAVLGQSPALAAYSWVAQYGVCHEHVRSLTHLYSPSGGAILLPATGGENRQDPLEK